MIRKASVLSELSYDHLEAEELDHHQNSMSYRRDVGNDMQR